MKTLTIKEVKNNLDVYGHPTGAVEIGEVVPLTCVVATVNQYETGKVVKLLKNYNITNALVVLISSQHDISEVTELLKPHCDRVIEYIKIVLNDFEN